MIRRMTMQMRRSWFMKSYVCVATKHWRLLGTNRAGCSKYTTVINQCDWLFDLWLQIKGRPPFDPRSKVDSPSIQSLVMIIRDGTQCNYEYAGDGQISSRWNHAIGSLELCPSHMYYTPSRKRMMGRVTIPSTVFAHVEKQHHQVLS